LPKKCVRKEMNEESLHNSRGKSWSYERFREYNRKSEEAKGIGIKKKDCGKQYG